MGKIGDLAATTAPTGRLLGNLKNSMVRLPEREFKPLPWLIPFSFRHQVCWADKTGALAAATVPPRSHLIGKSESLYIFMVFDLIGRSDYRLPHAYVYLTQTRR
ncbi:uncharacterized protein [Triticum aestivum]|uniref:uncharacterized protein isoform X2 n=1 Tax=Triticum aestivum TaxID=4565 RepID=UPI001D012FC4|nr:uncharacterized protein LOC123150695 isoform X2 [Triticum aestivum]